MNQSGSGNTGDIVQTETGTYSMAYIEQSADNGSATIFQGDFQGGNFGDFGEAHIYQLSGSGNEASIKQRSHGVWNDHEITQRGVANSASIDAYNGGQRGDIYQQGTNNSATLKQAHSGINRADIDQGGSGNGYNVVGNTATVQQNRGDNNYARVRQAGDGNTIAGSAIDRDGLGWYGIQQQGHDNDAYAIQTGSFNTGAISQFGMHDDANLVQSGLGNTGSIIQGTNPAAMGGS
ncbi:MAG: hypothetical protein U5K31_00470 [Balneolaceae bacterium]|nr:hypothetical protein [Balneolaceae bacterium]